jgi:carbonic anhydrase/acetyltransferase-like protein (isoleucine patch superfamily)
MIVTHFGERPHIHPSAYVAPNAVICGDVTVGPGCRIMFGACVVAEGGRVELGENCIVMENAVVRSTAKHSTKVGSHNLIEPHAHLVGCTLEDSVFIATGASVFHGAHLGYGAEVRVGAVVHLRTRLPAHASVPIGWVAVGDPAQILPPGQHEQIWAVQKPLNFPRFVYGVERPPAGESNMAEITRLLSAALASHMDDVICDVGAEHE